MVCHDGAHGTAQSRARSEACTSSRGYQYVLQDDLRIAGSLPFSNDRQSNPRNTNLRRAPLLLVRRASSQLVLGSQHLVLFFRRTVLGRTLADLSVSDRLLTLTGREKMRRQCGCSSPGSASSRAFWRLAAPGRATALPGRCTIPCSSDRTSCRPRRTRLSVLPSLFGRCAITGRDQVLHRVLRPRERARVYGEVSSEPSRALLQLFNLGGMVVAW
ncbi:hypothetical protein VTK73DRAFT_9936 [Phialemonium thermophilum]|uniref:Uncharacterized protein n=1 Tax=Phialemonium thermophilum TaxID=223376 RepID=A0ABR3VZL7_9PEZI